MAILLNRIYNKLQNQLSYVNLNIGQTLLRRLSHLQILQGQLGPILDEEGGQDGPVLKVGDVVGADQRIQEHRHGLEKNKQV